jgi:hypothetical protein
MPLKSFKYFTAMARQGDFVLECLTILDIDYKVYPCVLDTISWEVVWSANADVRQKFLMELKLVQPLPPVEQQIQQIRDPEQQIRDPDQRTQYPKRSVVTISRFNFACPSCQVRIVNTKRGYCSDCSSDEDEDYMEDIQ